MATVVLVGTLDTKAKEYEFVRRCLCEDGLDTLLMDVGFGGEPGCAPDVDAASVLAMSPLSSGRTELYHITSGARAHMLQAMGEGAAQMLQKLIGQGRCDAVFGMGGGGGTNLLIQAFRPLPRGFPKMIVSTILGQDIHSVIGDMDCCLVNAVTDIAGVNRVSKLILANAAFAVGGMARLSAGLVRAGETQSQRMAPHSFEEDQSS